MTFIKNILLFPAVALFAFSMVFAAPGATEAQDATPETEGSTTTNAESSVAPYDAQLDEAISPEELGVEEPSLLPDSPFYFFKSWGRAIRSAVTFNPVKKAELKLRYANEKLLEAEKLASRTDDESAIEGALENYEEEMEEVKTRAERLEGRENKDTERFLDKLTDYELKKQKLMDRLTKVVPERARERVLKAQEKSVEKFAAVITRLEKDREKLRERIEEKLEAQEGSQFKNFKNLEVLLRVEEKVPAEAKEAIRRAQENTLKRLGGDLSKMSPTDREKFKEYLEEVGGNELRHAEILEKLEDGELDEDIKEKIKEARERTINRVEDHLKSLNEERRQKYLEILENNDLDKIRVLNRLEKELREEERDKIREIKARNLQNLEREAGEAGEDEEGRERFLEKWDYGPRNIEILKEIKERTDINAREALERVIERGEERHEERRDFLKNIRERADEENEREYEINDDLGERERERKQIYCTQEYDPVCGVNGKTFSNACHARVAEVAIKHQGKCAAETNSVLRDKYEDDEGNDEDRDDFRR